MVAFIVKDSIIVGIVNIIKENLQHVFNGFVHKLFVKSSGLYCFNNFCIIDTAACRHFKVKARLNSLGTVGNSSPVRHYISLESPFVTENIRKKLFVFCRIGSVYLVVAAHHCLWLAFLYGNFKTAKVDFTECSFVQLGTHAHSEIFLIVGGKMLYGSSNIPFLNSLDFCRSNFSGQIWVFGIVFKVSSAQWASLDVHGRSKKNGNIVCTALLAKGASHFFNQVRVKTGCRCTGCRKANGGQCSSILVHFAQSVGTVGNHYGWNSQSFNRFCIPKGCTGTQRRFFFKCHLRDDFFNVTRHSDLQVR